MGGRPCAFCSSVGGWRRRLGFSRDFSRFLGHFEKYHKDNPDLNDEDEEPEEDEEEEESDDDNDVEEVP